MNLNSVIFCFEFFVESLLVVCLSLYLDLFMDFFFLVDKLSWCERYLLNFF